MLPPSRLRVVALGDPSGATTCAQYVTAVRDGQPTGRCYAEGERGRRFSSKAIPSRSSAADANRSPRPEGQPFIHAAKPPATRPPLGARFAFERIACWQR